MMNPPDTLFVDPETAADAWELLEEAGSVLIATHANPDADAVASVLALRLVLSSVVPTVLCATGDGSIPPNLLFLPGAESLIRDLASIDVVPDRIVLVDCADPSRLGPLFHRYPTWFDGSVPMLNVDHHVTNTRFGHINLVESHAASTTAILAHWFLASDTLLSPDVATCLLAGLYGDTLSFQTTSTNAEAFDLAALLLRAGARLDEIVNHLFRRKSLSTIRLWAAALQRVRYEPPIIWTEVTLDMLEETGATPAEGEGIVNFLSGTEGTAVAILFYEQPESWRVSLRSSDTSVDVAAICQQYGGGGHARAAGCRLPAGPESRQRFLADLTRTVTESLATRSRIG